MRDKFNTGVIKLNKRGVKKILLAVAAFFAFAYEFYTFVPDRIIYINGAANALPQFVSGIPEENPNKTEQLKLFGVVPYKSVAVDVIEDKRVILGGESIGVNINVDGVMVLGFSDFYGEDGKKHCPAKDAGLKIKDVITKVNGEKITSAGHFSSIVDKNFESAIDICFNRDGEIMSTKIVPLKSAEDGEYHLGLWARDGTSGIGTLTFIQPETKMFGALGHSINDAETGDIIKLGTGNIYYSSITDVKAASKGSAGELRGCFISAEIGGIEKNTEFGIFGSFYGKTDAEKAVSIAPRSEIKEGEAFIFCCINGEKTEKFQVYVEKINLNSYDNKSMVIKVTDENLISRTGGIVQGMSGSPIVQNGKLIGAVTHVFVNDPTRGYAIFIDTMAEACRSQ